MKILLTGQNGYIGSHILRMIQVNYPEAEIVEIKKDSHGEYNVPENWGHPSDFRVADYKGITHVIHAGAKASTAATWQDAMKWNYEFTIDIAKAFRGTYFMFFSSCAADPPCHTPYGLSKLGASEWLLENQPNVCIFKPFNVYGKEVGRPHKLSNPENIVRRQVKNIVKPFVRDYIHIDDCLRMIRHALDNETTGQHEMGTGIGYDFDELCEMGDIDMSNLEIVRPGHAVYPIVGAADRVAKTPYLRCEISVREWIRREAK